MKQVNIDGSKKIVVGRSCVAQATKNILHKASTDTRVLIISDREVAGYYLETFIKMVVNAGKEVDTLILEPGDQLKTMEQMKPVFEKYIDLAMDQKDYIFILGGGSVIDLALFAMSIFSKAINTVVFPTTLFSMIETGLGHSANLNFQGRKDCLRTPLKTFEVVVDTAFLRSLPVKVVTNGAAVIIQYGILMNMNLLTQLSAPKDMAHIIESAIITGNKIRDIDLRWLNMGRDIGDAIEAHFRYYNYTPGESLALGLYTHAPSPSLKALYSRLGLPVCVDGVTRDTLMKRIKENMIKTDKGIEIIKLNEKRQPIVNYFKFDDALLYYEKALNMICK